MCLKVFTSKYILLLALILWSYIPSKAICESILYTEATVTLGKKIPPQGEKIPPQHGTFEIESQPKSRNELLRELPKGLQERVAKLGKRASREKVSQLLVDLCAFKPYSYEELALIIQRAAKPMKDKYLKPLRLANKLFYWIPEMINHPLQKYVAAPSMARSNTKKK